MSPSFVLAAGNAPLIQMGPLDIVIIAIYFVVVLGIGVYLKRYVSTGEDFFMAGRKMTAWIAGLSFISANLSSLETMGWSAMAYQYGMLGAHAYLIGAIPAILFLSIVMMPFYYICKTHSVPGYLKLRFGTGSSALAGISFALLTVLVSGASMFAMAKILHLLLGWNMDVSIWVCVADRRGLRDPGRSDLGGLQRGPAVLPHLVRVAADPDPRPHRRGGLERTGGEDPAERAGDPPLGGQCELHQPVAKPGLVRHQPDGYRLVRDGLRPGPGGELRVLVHRFPPGAAGDRGQGPARAPERDDHRRGAQDAGAASS